jgi:hypothetical protein
MAAGTGTCRLVEEARVQRKKYRTTLVVQNEQ